MKLAGNEPDEKDWILYLNGQEIVRVRERDDIELKYLAKLLSRSQGKFGETFLSGIIFGCCAVTLNHHHRAVMVGEQSSVFLLVEFYITFDCADVHRNSYKNGVRI